jgi:predicted DNA binding CopG/RHH family protein
MMNALQGKPNVSKAQNKKLFDMTKLYGEVDYNNNNIDDFAKDTINLIDQLTKTIEVSQQDSVDMGSQLRSNTIDNLTFTATDIMSKLEELDIDETIKDDLMGELEYVSDENGEHDNYTKVGKIVSAIEEIKFNLKKLEKKSKIKKESFNEERRLYVESIAAVKNKAEKTGMPYNILKQVYDRGMAAWKGGHRPGATQVQWALARVNSFVTKSSGTWGGADKDLAKQVKG